jgi:hypothetical protein
MATEKLFTVAGFIPGPFLKGLEHDVKLFKNQNHCNTLDNYLEKYLPIHVQH